MDPVLSSSLQVLFSGILKLLNQEVRLQADLENGLRKLQTVAAVVEEMIKKEEGQGEGVDSGKWLRSLRSVVHDADEVFQEFETEARRRSCIKTLPGMRSNLSKLNPKRLLFNHGLGKKIDDIEKKVALLAKTNSMRVHGPLGPRGNETTEGGMTTTRRGRPVYGRDNDLEEIISKLTKDNNNGGNKAAAATTETTEGTNISVLAIVGMTGMGKTTLAQEVCNRTQSIFESIMWVHVSPKFHIIQLTRMILESAGIEATSNHWALENLDVLQERLREKLEGRRYLLVLDDMWITNSKNIDLLFRPLHSAAKGSWILITTQREEVATNCIHSIMSPSGRNTDHKQHHIHRIRRLSDDACFKIFYEQARLVKDDSSVATVVEDIHPEIKHRCAGSPMMAKTLGSLLPAHEPTEWRRILDSYEGMDTENNEMHARLRIAYKHMPHQLKEFFRFSSIFPKGFRFEKEPLVLLWMSSLSLLFHDTENKEDRGYHHFHGLVKHSFFEQAPDDSSKFLLHDLLHELAQYISSEECNIIEQQSTPNEELRSSFTRKTPSEEVRHSSFICNGLDSNDSVDISFLTKYIKLHTLIFLGDSLFSIQNFPDILTKHLVNLRTLDLSCTGITTLAESIGCLKHLHYLGLSNTNIETLPKSMNCLYNLQTLMLRDCCKLVKFPQNIGNLSGLRHIHLSLVTDFGEEIPTVGGDEKGGEKQKLERPAILDSLQFLPGDIGDLTNLRSLTRFAISNQKGYAGLSALKNLNRLHGDLRISILHIVSLQEVIAAKLEAKKDIRRLRLEWPLDSADTSKDNEQILEELRPHSGLSELRLQGFRATKLPNWLSCKHLTCLQKLTISNSKKCDALPSLGQLRTLKHLRLNGMDNIEILDCSLCGSDTAAEKDIVFPSLKILVIENMPRLKRWSGTESCNIPNIKEVTIRNCPDLRILIHGLSSLDRLIIEGCQSLRRLDGITSLHSLEVKNSGDCIWQQKERPFFPSLYYLTLYGLQATIPLLNFERCTQLTRLEIRHCPHIPYLPSGFGMLSALEELEIGDCKNLMSLPDDINKLKKLRRIILSGCPTLSCLPEHGLPLPSLQYFSINNCPCLELCLGERQSADREKIKRIPQVRINCKNLVVYIEERTFSADCKPKHGIQ